MKNFSVSHSVGEKYPTLRKILKKVVNRKKCASYIDVCAGPGIWCTDDFREYSGSPVVALSCLPNNSKVKRDCIFIENNRQTFIQLNANIGGKPGVRLFCEDYSKFDFTRNPPKYNQGLMFVDPEKSMIDSYWLSKVSGQLPLGISILIHYGTGYMRKHPFNPFTVPMVLSLKELRKHVYVSNPKRRHGWTFVLFSSTPQEDVTKELGFESFYSSRGEQWLLESCTTRKYRIKIAEDTYVGPARF